MRVLEVGCGREGGVAPVLAEAGYDVLAIDPDAPDGPLYRRVTLEELDDEGPFDAVVAGRVLHHLDPLGPALDKLRRSRRCSSSTSSRGTTWTTRLRSGTRASIGCSRPRGAKPKGPPDLDEWRWRHAGLHPYETLRAEVDARYDQLHFEWRPFLYRWLDGPATESLEQGLIDAGAIRPIGFRYARRENRDGALLGAKPGNGPERLLELALQLARGRQLLDDVGAADQLTADEQLRDRRPAGDALTAPVGSPDRGGRPPPSPALLPLAARAARDRSSRT